MTLEAPAPQLKVNRKCYKAECAIEGYRVYRDAARQETSIFEMDGQAVPSAWRKRAGNSNEKLPPEIAAKVRKVYANNKVKSSPSQEEPVAAIASVSKERLDLVGKKMHRIKLKSHDGKDLGHVNLFMKPEQAKTLNGKTIKVAKLNSTKQVNNLANNKPKEVLNVARKKEIVLPTVSVSSREGSFIQQDLCSRAKDLLKNHSCGPKMTNVFTKIFQRNAKDVQPKLPAISKVNEPKLIIIKRFVPVEPPRPTEIPPAREQPTPQKREFVEIPFHLPKEVKIENDEILIDVQSSTTAQRHRTEEKDPLADSSASTTADRRDENYQQMPLIIIKHPIKRLADKNPVLASFLKNPTTCTPKENIAEPAGSNSEKEESLSVIEQAMNSISDKSLREKALKALADCGLRVVRHLPVVPEDPTRTVCESEAQTEVFGLLEQDSFVLAEEKSLDLKRIPQRAHELPKTKVDASVQVEAAGLEPTIPDIPVVCVPDNSSLDSIDLESFFNTWSTENSEVSRVKNVLSQQDKRITETLAAQLRRDFDSIKMYGEDGMLGIHRAVVDNNPAEVRRLLFMLKACQEDANVETAKGVTCLELAISSGASSEIVSALLKAGATPVSVRLVHDSAIILASKQSSCHLRDLIVYVKDPFLLNLTGPEGFSALHYCATLGNLDGVRILLEAGANVNMRDSRSGRTALFHAVENNHVKISALLYEKGAAVTTPNFSGQTVLSLLQDTTNSRLKKTFGQLLGVGQRS